MTLDRDQLSLIHRTLLAIKELTSTPNAKTYVDLLLSLIDEYERQTQVTP